MSVLASEGSHLSDEQVALLDALDDAELAQLARSGEDLPEIGPAAREHLVGCERCSAQRASLDAVGALLAAGPGPGPMPEDVVAALDARLAAERPAQDRETGASVLPLRPSRRSGAPGRQHALLAQAAAVLGIVAVGGALAVGAVRSGSGANDSASTSAKVAADAPAAPAPEAAGSAGGDASLRELRSGSAYTATTVGATVTALLAPNGLMTDSRAPTAAAAASSPGEDVGVDPGCLTGLAAGAGRRPVLVDTGTWQGVPARLVVLRWAEDPSRGDAYVVSPTCRAGAEGVLFYAGVRLP